MKACNPRRFVPANCRVQGPPLVPEIELYLASEGLPLWQAGEAELAAAGLPEPFWAFAWAGGQGLARYLLDNPALIASKRALDFAAGSGLAGIAAALAGANRIEAADTDPFALAALTHNGALNGVALEALAEDLIGRANPGWDVVLAGDVCYEQPLAARAFPWLKDMAAGGALVLLGDPGRSYLPKTGLERLAAYGLKTCRALEDTDLRNAVVWRVL
ncbi:MAG: 50S ribosomal protein L11 methyltransferase [Pseudomonadota bacterium]